MSLFGINIRRKWVCPKVVLLVLGFSAFPIASKSRPPAFYSSPVVRHP